MAIEVQLASESAQVPSAASLEAWAAAALGGDPRDVCLRIVDREEGHRLNSAYRSIDKATNVLSFPVGELPSGAALLGDIVICAPVVEAEAREQDKSVEHHYAHMVVHGVLHLLGHDHEDDGEAQIMESEEVRVLRGLGITDPYVAL
jgi:probable rRNA maturation factor